MGEKIKFGANYPFKMYYTCFYGWVNQDKENFLRTEYICSLIFQRISLVFASVVPLTTGHNRYSPKHSISAWDYHCLNSDLTLIMILPALALQESFCQHQMACAIMRRKYWPLLTYILQALTSAFTLSPRRIAFLQTHLMSPFPLCSVAMAPIKCSKVFMCRTNSAKEAIVLAHSTQSYRRCTLTSLIASVTHCYLRPELRLRGILVKPPRLKDV